MKVSLLFLVYGTLCLVDCGWAQTTNAPLEDGNERRLTVDGALNLVANNITGIVPHESVVSSSPIASVTTENDKSHESQVVASEQQQSKPKLARVPLTNGDVPSLNDGIDKVNPIDSEIADQDQVVSDPAFFSFNRDVRTCDGVCTEYGETDQKAFCSQGCRFFILAEMLANESDPNVKLSKAKDVCSKSCTSSHQNERSKSDICIVGCSKSANLVTDKSALNASAVSTEKNQLEKESDEIDEMKDPNNIFLRVDPFGSGSSLDGPQTILQLVLRRLQAMRERATAEFLAPQEEPSPSESTGFKQTMARMRQIVESFRNGVSVKEDQAPDSSDWSPFSNGGFSFQKSMTIVNSHDENGNRRVIIMSTPPKLIGFRFSSGRLADDDHFSLRSPVMIAHSGDSSNLFDSSDRRGVVTVVSPPSRERRFLHCLYSILPRLFFLCLFLTLLYLIFWVFCTSLAMTSVRRVMVSETSEKLAHKTKAFLSGKRKYFQLNKTSGMDQVAPPSYTDVCVGSDDKEADALPEKRPIP